MAKLVPGVKRFIVQALACYDTPTQVVEAVKEEFGLDVTRMQVSAYDPDKKMGENLSAELVSLFRETRKKFKDETENIPIAQRAYRLRVMQRVVAKAETSRNMALALQVLEQAAKETGDAYVNRHRGTEDEKDAPVPTKVERSVKDARRK
ncbi:MAG TPA: DUF2280 domain-containing protein [Solimonas sp.]